MNKTCIILTTICIFLVLLFSPAAADGRFYLRSGYLADIDQLQEINIINPVCTIGLSFDLHKQGNISVEAIMEHTSGWGLPTKNTMAKKTWV
ncbi:MAG: hypothetical protein KAU21_11895 [Gammaproteobacteria bacterium]|nr:hypothetical protein [Gammaproteobacteria bacterium]